MIQYLFASFVLAGNDFTDINLEDLNISLPPNTVASVAAISSTQIQNLAAALVWLEE